MPRGGLGGSGSWFLLAPGCLLGVHDAVPLREGTQVWSRQTRVSVLRPPLSGPVPLDSVLAAQSICVLTYICVHVLWPLVVFELRTGSVHEWKTCKSHEANGGFLIAEASCRLL